MIIIDKIAYCEEISSNAGCKKYGLTVSGYHIARKPESCCTLEALMKCESMWASLGGLASKNLAEPTGSGAESIKVKDDFPLALLVCN